MPTLAPSLLMISQFKEDTPVNNIPIVTIIVFSIPSIHRRPFSDGFP